MAWPVHAIPVDAELIANSRHEAFTVVCRNSQPLRVDLHALFSPHHLLESRQPNQAKREPHQQQPFPETFARVFLSKRLHKVVQGNVSSACRPTNEPISRLLTVGPTHAAASRTFDSNLAEAFEGTPT